MSTLKDVLSLDATAQAELIRKKEIKPLELVEAAIAGIERLNPQINAVVTFRFEHGTERTIKDTLRLKDLNAFITRRQARISIRRMEHS
jgi:Asp-tRNA(Asn)/Glu-tRNA(Gln) amidotransferase A subunit family amidase